ncbi:MAG: hydantoinase/oxoprolinase family protein, partial [Gemmatimonadales bacterium]
VNFHLTAFGTMDKPKLPRLRAARTARTARKGAREVDFDVHGRREAALYERSFLAPRAKVKGPAIIEEPAATTVIFPGQRAEVDRFGNLIIEVKA